MLEFRPSVYALAVRDGKVLLMCEMDKWCLPGGGVEKGETLREALVRETREETGMVVEPGSLLFVRESFFIVPPGAGHIRPVQSFLFFYHVRIMEEGGALLPANAYEREHIYGCEWVDLEKAVTLPFLGSFAELRDEIIEFARTL
ncbi:MAG: NUDIX domain-containing protein [Patescibacteria group bacterium]